MTTGLPQVTTPLQPIHSLEAPSRGVPASAAQPAVPTHLDIPSYATGTVESSAQTAMNTSRTRVPDPASSSIQGPLSQASTSAVREQAAEVQNPAQWPLIMRSPFEHLGPPRASYTSTNEQSVGIAPRPWRQKILPTPCSPSLSSDDPLDLSHPTPHPKAVNDMSPLAPAPTVFPLAQPPANPNPAATAPTATPATTAPASTTTPAVTVAPRRQPSAAPSQSTAALTDPILSFCSEIGLSADVAARLRELGITDDARIRALGRDCQDQETKAEMKRDLQEAGFDWAARTLILNGLARRSGLKRKRDE
ncbi:uncharacterized protein BXZ73DRAFT_103955 [Epithele typhae]|uniref:uncharacterized protein n=1 Tax=Epithele typhae TaxID=378194 RepID=UPI0020076EE8|nr:uncharacterized protein BXZ73DRAFT_103955 [Epithele typhae]KAH9923157.1 hypothetical protein BXZ73DRAFT_103955 [Epithele typhae]